MKKNILITASFILFAIIIIVFVIVLADSNNTSIDKKDSSIGQESKTQTEAETLPETETSMPPEPDSTKDTETPSTGTTDENDIEKKESFKVKALYITPYTIASKLEHYIQLANTTEINAYVLDIKEWAGEICYTLNGKETLSTPSYQKIYDVTNVIKQFHDNKIYAIGRIVCFKDNYLPRKNNSFALRLPDGRLYETTEPGGNKTTWLDPAKKENWEYLGNIIEEAISVGFDEIQFDYVRFPEKRYTNSYAYNSEVPHNKHIEGFLEYIRSRFPNIPLSADIFGIPCISEKDLGQIGQQLETVGLNIDYISPMIYPSHYANSSKGVMGNGVGQQINAIVFDKPDLMPYEVIYNTLLVTKKRLDTFAAENKQLPQVKVRPYLQGFTATYLPKGYYKEYGVQEYRQQIEAVYDVGYEEWIFWNANNKYVESAFEKEPNVENAFSNFIKKIFNWSK